MKKRESKVALKQCRVNDSQNLSEERKKEKIHKKGPNYHREINMTSVFRMVMRVKGRSWQHKISAQLVAENSKYLP